MRTIALTEETRKNVLENLLKRSPSSYGKFEDAVAEIVENVRNNKDAAVFEYTKRFDGADINARNIKVTKEEIDEAYEQVDPSLLDVIRKALVNIREYHEKQKKYSWFDSKPDGTMLGQKVMPLAKVGVYVPGGKAVYPSSVLMNVVPAKVAGVEKIIMTTPCGKDGKVYPSTLVAAMEAGADEIYKVGGAQAIAAMAFGTESIPKVDKITGPGNIFVALAKKENVDFVCVTPDDPLALGCVDRLEEEGIPAFGPTAYAAQMEASKIFSKNLMRKYGIPTAKCEIFTEMDKALAYLDTQKAPIVVKADGLALGKGVVVAATIEEAKNAVIEMMEGGKFGKSGARVLIEECMVGREVTVLCFCDGKTIVPMKASQDHKRVFDGDKGPNTGGMGAFAPSPLYTRHIAERTEREILLPTLRAMNAEGFTFKGVLYVGLMLTKDGP